MPVQPLTAERWSILSPIISRLHSGYSFFPRENDTYPKYTVLDQANLFRILILRCSSHADVEESLTHITLFDLIYRHFPDALIDIAFFPDKHDQILLEKAGLQWPLSIRSLSNLADFDLVMINVSYVLEFLNLPQILAGSGIPLWTSERTNNDPMIVVGGAASLSAQSIIRFSDKGFDALGDVLFFGELEDSIGPLLSACSPNRSRVIDRDQQLLSMSKVEGCWIPRLNNPVRKSVCRSVDETSLYATYPVLNGKDATTCRAQISFGCPFSCSFCFEGFERKPYRDRNATALLSATSLLRQMTGARSLDIISFNFNTHKELSDLMPEFSRQFRHVHFMSQRLDILQRTRHLLENELAAEKRSYTLGIEGISGRFRQYFDKKLADFDISQLCLRLLQAKVKEIKFFFIITGLETDQDLDEFNRFLGEIQEKRRVFHPGCRLVASFGVLCRMPFTPLQFSALMIDPNVYSLILEECKSACTSAGVEFRTAFSRLDFQAAQILCLGGWETNELLMNFHRAGISFGGNLPGSAKAIIDEFVAGSELSNSGSPKFFSEKDMDWAFPLEFVDIGQDKLELYRRFVACKEALHAPLPSSRSNLIGQVERGWPDQRKILADLFANKQRANWTCWQVKLPAGIVGATPSWIDAWLARGIFDLLGNQNQVIDVELDSRFRSVPNLPYFWHGKAIVRIASVYPIEPLLVAVLGKVAGNGLVIESPWAHTQELVGFKLETVLPIALERATHAWNKLLPVLGMKATLRKSVDQSQFDFSPRQAGKKHLSHLLLSRKEQITLMECTAGPKTDMNFCLQNLGLAREYPVLITAIHDILV